MNLYPGFRDAMQASLKTLQIQIGSKKSKKYSKKFSKGNKKN
ncbi:hypothetical protein LEP1GSC062_4085 [Leptospira alexanderi serovar Manhao 3 str. L 60]|uniref:Uncharacterized protein n=1 Tax=Leptospira alexanderi serovar Manhao 3 str. L 60 TaxID=1049759 RepID=V6IAC4_9LEPT|nr:hypothetical protein LEP1GSC062_4085 [Leptospira alexanderi serovar Manhao 3 str. L 60]